jgi:predicted  nucleic acid-binding Zn ribbon protein
LTIFPQVLYGFIDHFRVKNMYVIEVKIPIKNKLDSHKQFDMVNELLGLWRKNGQILGGEFPIIKKKDCYLIYVNTHERSSLSSKNHNKYLRKHYNDFISVGLMKPNINVLGKEHECCKICKCKTQNYFILFTTFLSTETPLRCGDCFGSIPLYKIPKTYNDEYYNIICWESNYQSCDTLQMKGEVGERFAINQLSSLDSPLTKSGLKVCQSIKKVTGKKTYYYLYKGSGISSQLELSRKCPGCGGKWHQKQPVHDIFDFMCKQCSLLSNVAWGIR